MMILQIKRGFLSAHTNFMSKAQEAKKLTEPAKEEIPARWGI